MLCGGKSEDEEADLGFWRDGWFEGSPILAPERIVDPLVLDLRQRRCGVPRRLRLPPVHKLPLKSEASSSAPPLRLMPDLPLKVSPRLDQGAVALEGVNLATRPL